MPHEEFKAVLNRLLRLLLDEDGSVQKVNSRLVDDVRGALSGLCLLPSSVVVPAWIGEADRPTDGDLLPMANGLLDLNRALNAPDDGLLGDPTPAWFSTASWPYEYDPSVECPTWMEFLREILPSKATRAILQEFIGYCLTFDTSYHKFLVLVGDGANGKSVVTEVATHLLGRNNVSHVGLERFGDRV